VTNGRRVAICVMATLGLSVSLMDRQSLAAVGPMLSSYGMGRKEFGLLGSVFALAYLVCTPLAGRLVTSRGPRVVLAVAVVLWSLVAAGHAFATTFAWFAVGRLLLGITEAPSFPGSADAIRRALPEEKRSLGIGLLFTGSSIGAAVAAPLALWAAVRYGLGGAFVIPAACGLLWLIPWLWVSRDLHGPAEPGVPPAPLLSVLKEPALHRQVLGVLASAPCNMIVLIWFAQFLVDTSGVAKADTGHYLWLPPLVFDAGALLFGALAMRVASRRGLMLVAGLMVLALAFSTVLSTPWLRVGAGALALAGGAGMYVIGTSDLMSHLPKSKVSTAMGFSASVQSVVQIIMGPVVGGYLDRTHAWSTVTVAIACLGVPGAVLWVLHARKYSAALQSG
jgi:MFS transporter, ACS family, hexuronate transporter